MRLGVSSQAVVLAASGRTAALLGALAANSAGVTGANEAASAFGALTAGGSVSTLCTLTAAAVALGGTLSAVTVVLSSGLSSAGNVKAAGPSSIGEQQRGRGRRVGRACVQRAGCP